MARYGSGFMDRVVASLLQETADLPGSQMSAALAPASRAATPSRAARPRQRQPPHHRNAEYRPERIGDPLLRNIAGRTHAGVSCGAGPR